MITNEDVLESLPDGIIGVDNRLYIRCFNQEAEALCEVSRTTAIGRSLGYIFPKDTDFVDSISSAINTGRLLTDHPETLSRRFAGPVAVGITTNRIFDNNGEVIGALAAIKDRSGIKAMEGATLRKDRLAYIGTFAANLAHEIKNPLGGLRGAAQLITRKTDDTRLTDYADLIIREADRLNSIVENMLDFSRPARMEAKELNIHQLLDSTVSLLTDEGVELIRAYDPSLPPISGDAGTLRQVFLNLIKNGVEATANTGRQGTVRIETRMGTDFHLAEEGARPGKMAEILIHDNGTGIEKTDMEQVFTPFFTTKSKGSGLGMALSLKIVHEHHGLIKIDSIPGKGSTITVYLPTA